MIQEKFAWVCDHCKALTLEHQKVGPAECPNCRSVMWSGTRMVYVGETSASNIAEYRVRREKKICDRCERHGYKSCVCASGIPEGSRYKPHT